MNRPMRQAGISLVEILVTTVLASLLLVGVQQLLALGMQSKASISQHIDLNREARFAMAHMVKAVRDTNRLLLPLADNPLTNYDENLRMQTVPASPPQGSSTLATAVLAVTVSPLQDLDADGIMDADNDGDGRIDEDLPEDNQNDGKAGIRDFDDDGNGIKDHYLSPAGDDDESNNLAENEDAFNGIDDDGDGSIDEDPGADNNGDSAPGIAGVDDDGDSLIDEGSIDDDDEDGAVDEDWFDPVVFYLQGSNLLERRAVPWDENSDSVIDGRDFVESILANNVTLIRFERVALTGSQQLVDITLTLTDQNGENLTLNTRIRVGGVQ